MKRIKGGRSCWQVQIQVIGINSDPEEFSVFTQAVKEFEKEAKLVTSPVGSSGLVPFLTQAGSSDEEPLTP